tara:strand:- start:220 stop:1476 length:1257 start_codon:yes stop_codon:yes gene_type:complete
MNKDEAFNPLKFERAAINDFFRVLPTKLNADYIIPKSKTVRKLLNIEYFVCPGTESYLRQAYSNDPNKSSCINKIHYIFAPKTRSMVYKGLAKCTDNVSDLHGSYYVLGLSDAFFVTKLCHQHYIKRVPSYFVKEAIFKAREKKQYLDISTSIPKFVFRPELSSLIKTATKEKLKKNNFYNDELIQRIDASGSNNIGNCQGCDYPTTRLHDFFNSQWLDFIRSTKPNYTLNDGLGKIRYFYYSTRLNEVMKNFNLKHDYLLSKHVRAEIKEYLNQYKDFPEIISYIGIKHNLGHLLFIRYGLSSHISYIDKDKKPLTEDFISYMRGHHTYLDTINTQNSVMQYRLSDLHSIESLSDEISDILGNTSLSRQDRINHSLSQTLIAHPIRYINKKDAIADVSIMNPTIPQHEAEIYSIKKK